MLVLSLERFGNTHTHTKEKKKKRNSRMVLKVSENNRTREKSNCEKIHFPIMRKQPHFNVGKHYLLSLVQS